VVFPKIPPPLGLLAPENNPLVAVGPVEASVGFGVCDAAPKTGDCVPEAAPVEPRFPKLNEGVLLPPEPAAPEPAPKGVELGEEVAPTFPKIPPPEPVFVVAPAEPNMPPLGAPDEPGVLLRLKMLDIVERTAGQGYRDRAALERRDKQSVSKFWAVCESRKTREMAYCAQK
jgi:hypothetical protein